MSSRQIYLVDDDPRVLEALACLLKDVGYPVYSYRSGEDFLANVPESAQGCVILDVKLAGIDGLAVQSWIVKQNLPLKVIVISGHADVPTAVKSVKLGAVEFLEKPFHPAELTSLIDELMREEFGALVGGLVCSELSHERFSMLTDREMIVLKGIVRGLSNRELTDLVGMSLRTVQFCRKSIFEKTGFKNRAELMNWIVMNSIDLASFPP